MSIIDIVERFPLKAKEFKPVTRFVIFRALVFSWQLATRQEGTKFPVIIVQHA